MKKSILFIWIICFHFVGLFAQAGLHHITFSGKIHENGVGIANVAVTDGFNISYTDKNGEYRLISNSTADFVYFTQPQGYDIPLKGGIPYFYSPVTDKSKKEQRFDFELKKSNRNDDVHTMIVWADPQVYYEEELALCKNAAGDTKKTAGEYTCPVYGIVCGDIVGDHPEFYGSIRNMLAETGVPFFFTPGNHDMNLDVRSDDLSKATYKKTFGPDYYSFNRGKIHYVVLDDVFYVGRSYWYIGYLPERQLAWLQQDLSSVAPGSTVIVMLHIPTSTRETQAQENMQHTMQNRQHLHQMLQPYNAHIFSGHMHYNDNIVVNENLFEHVHAAVCGVFWQGPECSDGTPQGYGVYEINGSNVSWYYKSVGHSGDFQFRAYSVGENPEKPQAVTANVWNYDPQWKVQWYENGIPRGDMIQYEGHDPYTTDYIRKNKDKFRYSWISTGVTGHLFYAEPTVPDAKIKIEVTDRFGKKYVKELP